MMCTINSVCQYDLLLFVGDFNLQGWIQPLSVEWSGISGNQGVAEISEAVRTLLTSCAVNGLTVLSTWYEKKDMYKYTWQNQSVALH